ncbi:hypothetical protein KPH14_012948 [Odynerus spinipes]|uniref:Uncharacterized protein n=1 Tax=Odynerus spinipes TaxID=1348599 RepID=A0AAD9VI83_9HYME|nr:hypothetical protein KPH14_012948 [Odynerus spinipes]
MILYKDLNGVIQGDIGKNKQQYYNKEILKGFAFKAPIIQGRPIEKLGKVNNIYPPRDLLMRDIKYPIADNLTTQSNPESIFYLVNAKPEIQSSYNRKAVGESNKNALSLKDVNLTFNNSSVVNFDYDVRSLGYFNYQLGDKKIGNDKINPSKNTRARVFDMMNLFTFMFRHIRSLPIESVQKIP